MCADYKETTQPEVFNLKGDTLGSKTVMQHNEEVEDKYKGADYKSNKRDEEEDKYKRASYKGKKEEGIFLLQKWQY